MEKYKTPQIEIIYLRPQHFLCTSECSCRDFGAECKCDSI